MGTVCLGRANSGANSDGREFAVGTVGALAVRWATVTSGLRRVIDENSYFVTQISMNRPLFVRYTPMRCTPVRYTPMRCTPVRCTFMRYTPMRCTTLQSQPPTRQTISPCSLLRHHCSQAFLKIHQICHNVIITFRTASPPYK